MGSCFKPTRIDESGTRIKCRRYRLVWTDENGDRKSKTAFRDKQASEAMLQKIERDVERRKAGLPVAETEKLRQPWEASLALFVTDMERLGRSERHRRATRQTVTRVFVATGWQSLADVRRDGLIAFLARKKAQGLAPRSLNHYIDKLHSFCEWSRKQGWFEQNPIADFDRSPIGDDQPHRTRALTESEFRQLVTCDTPHQDTYEVAGLSGLRRAELERLERRDVDLGTPDQPLWRLRVSATKGRRADVVPMLPDCLPAVLRVLDRTASGPTARLFPRLPSGATFRRDLDRAKVERFGPDGRRAAFHSLRKTFCTIVGKVLPIQVVRLLMRHTDISMTCRVYLDIGLDDLNTAILRLPCLFHKDEESAPTSAPTNNPPTTEVKGIPCDTDS